MGEQNLTTTTEPSGLVSRLRGMFRCMMGHHEPDRRKVTRDRIYYVGKCHRCGKPIRKRNGRSWEPFKQPDDGA